MLTMTISKRALTEVSFACPLNNDKSLTAAISFTGP